MQAPEDCMPGTNCGWSLRAKCQMCRKHNDSMLRFVSPDEVEQILSFLRQFPVELHAEVSNAHQRYVSGDYAEALNICMHAGYLFATRSRSLRLQRFKLQDWGEGAMPASTKTILPDELQQLHLSMENIFMGLRREALLE